MRRLLLYVPLCLPLCLVVAPDSPPPVPDSPAPALHEVADDGAPLPSPEKLVGLAKEDPVAFLEVCLRRYDREVRGYRCTLQKQERLGGKLQRSEVIDVDFREKPFAVLLDWREGARLAKRTLYVKGENGGKLLVRPAGWRGNLVGVVERDADSADARKSGRYPLTEFGLKVGMQRALAAWEAARKDNALHVAFLGEKKVPEAGGRACWVLKRTGYAHPEEDGITEATLYYDTETWLQVGSVVKGAGGALIGEYFFRDVKLNPKSDPDTFTRAALTR